MDVFDCDAFEWVCVIGFIHMNLFGGICLYGFIVGGFIWVLFAGMYLQGSLWVDLFG